LALATVTRRLAPVTAVVHTRRVAFPLRRSRKYRRGADRYVAISRAIGEQLLAVGLEPDRLDVVPSAVDAAAVDLAPATTELERPPGQALVGCVAAFSPEKGLPTLLAAWGRVMTALPEARLVLLGDGPERGAVERAAAALPTGSLLLAGFRDDVHGWLKRLDLYVQPSLCEGLGSSVLEAMACRLAVVASRAGGLQEAVEDGVTGLLVAPGDEAALAAAVLGLLSDPPRAAAMGAAGRARVEERFSVDAMLEGHLAVYRRAATAARS
jgi:glycosyltransferase involved in cell wall biosynthesis